MYNDDAMFDDESSSSTAGDKSMGSTKDEKSDETEDQLAMIPRHLFPEQPKPGSEWMFEVVHVYENEVAIKYAKDKKKDDKHDEYSEDSGGEGMGGEAEHEDAMMM